MESFVSRGWRSVQPPPPPPSQVDRVPPAKVFLGFVGVFLFLSFGAHSVHNELLSNVSSSTTSTVPFAMPKMASTCAELWSLYGITQNGNYTLNLGKDFDTSDNISATTPSYIIVECDFSKALKLVANDSAAERLKIDQLNEILTIVHHDTEDTGFVQGYEAPGAFVRNVTYYTSDAIESIGHIIRASFTCQQFIRWECRGSTFSFWFPKKHHSWWVDRNGRAQYYWGNAETDSRVCGCFPNCFPTMKNSTCNCDANLKNQWLEDSGLLLDASRIPVTRLHFGDTGESYEAGRYTLGPLICRNGPHKVIEKQTFEAPVRITSPGYPKRYPSPFRRYQWNVRVQQGQFIELVFPVYDIVHFGAYNSVPGCLNAMKVEVYVLADQAAKPQNATFVDDDGLEWVRVMSIEREKASPPYYVTDGRDTLFEMNFITCNQIESMVTDKKGFVAEFRESKCGGCNVDDTSITECHIEPDQCVFIYSAGYPFPHYLYGNQVTTSVHQWNLLTEEGNVIQIEFNDFDIISIPGMHYCDADVLTIIELDSEAHHHTKMDYCNINRFNIGKYVTASNMTSLFLRTSLKKVGNSRGIHATVRSIAQPRTQTKQIVNAAEGKFTDQSTTHGSLYSYLAVDGNYEQKDPAKCSSTNYEREPWWRVNLQKRHRITGVQIFSLLRKQETVSLETNGNLDQNFYQPRVQYAWPTGNYALPMPVSGCPHSTTHKPWLTGMRFHGVQHDKVYDEKTKYWSDGIMLKGGATGAGIEQHFCVHNSNEPTMNVTANDNNNNNNTNNTREPINWMPGKYCIIQYGDACPEGFHPGSLTWFDKRNDTNSSTAQMNYVEGFVPKGVYTDYNTTINFCCRDDGNPEVPIRLPKTRPFYLLQFGQVCQEVEGMSEVEHFFHYEEEVILSGSSVDYIFTSGQQLKFQDPHPRIDAILFERGLTLYYCYYDIADKLKGFQVLVDNTPDIVGYGQHYQEGSGISRLVNKPFLSAVECASYSVTDDEFDHITLTCRQPIEGQYVIIFMPDRNDALKLCEVKVFGEESCGRPLGMATEEVLDTAITASSFEQNYGLLYHMYNVRLNSPKAWCAQVSDAEKYIQIDLRPQNPSLTADSKSTIGRNNLDYVTIVGLEMQGMQMTFKNYFVSQFQLLFSNDSINWVYEEEPIGKQKIYKCVQCDVQNFAGSEIVMYNLLKPILTRFIRIKILSFRSGPCMRLELIGCRGNKNSCSRTLTASTPGVLSSPNYPYYYAQYQSCVWYIKPTNSSRHIELDFIVLDLATAEKSGGKCHDELQIQHTHQLVPISIGAGYPDKQYPTKSNSFQQKCYPKKIISNGAIIVTLKTCFRFTMSRYQGFLLRYRETDCPGCGVGDAQCSRIHNCSNLCGHILSINYPLHYRNNHRCQWLIRAPPDHYFNVTIEDFDIVDTLKLGKGQSDDVVRSKLSGCIFDHLSFTDVSNGNVLGRYCNFNKPPKYILSNWNELLIEFSTDSSTTGRGFRLKYKAQRYQLLEEVLPLLQPPPNACPFGWLYFRGYCYEAFVESDPLQWYQAEEKCQQSFKGRDGHLVSITDYLEMNVVHYWIIEHWKIMPHQSIYIGLIDTNKEGIYNWSDGNPMSYTDWFRTNSWVKDSSPRKVSLSNSVNEDLQEQIETIRLDDYRNFNQHSQPDGGAFEDCTMINFHSIHSTANWHDIPCSLGKKVSQVKSGFEHNANNNVPEANGTNELGGNNTSSHSWKRANLDGLIRSYICKIDSNSSVHQHSPRKTLFTGAIDENEKKLLPTRVNSNRYFVCNNYEVISNLFRCDGTANCRDGSDEIENCPANDKCLDSQFQCSNGHCIAIGKYCDFVDDCGDGSDEISCVRRHCKKSSEFKCNSGECIPITKRCDLLVDCQDQSDEGGICSGGKCNLNKTFQCYFGTCIPLHALCDRHRDCPGKFYEDEHESVCTTLVDDGQTYVVSANDLARQLRYSSNRMISEIKLDSTKRSTRDEPCSLEPREREKRPNETGGGDGLEVCFENAQKKMRTCQDLLLYHSINVDGFYELQPNLQNALTMRVYCRFLNSTHAMTIVHHDTEDRLYVRSSVNGQGTYVRPIIYDSSLDLIVALIDNSADCRQMLNYECSGSGFYFNTSKPNSWWVSRTETREFNWGGDNKDACACYPNCTTPGLRCNCDAGQFSWTGQFRWTRDQGYVENKDKLPVREVAFGDVYRIGQRGYVTIGPIECIGNVDKSNETRVTKMVGNVHFINNKNLKCYVDYLQGQPRSKQLQLIDKKEERKFQCDSGQIIKAEHICIFEFDQYAYQIGCRDVSHLRDCVHFQCPPDYVKCADSYCIPHRYICNGKWECTGGSDEIGCGRYTCPGRYKCANESSCILLHQLCDGFRHCPLGDDEWFCDLTCPESCICIGLYVNCGASNFTIQTNDWIPKGVRKLDLSWNDLGPDLATLDFSLFIELGELILQNNNIEVIRSRKFIPLTNLYKLDLRYNKLKTIEAGAFAGLQQVNSLMLDGNPTLEEIHSGAFVGLITLREMSINNTRLRKIEKNLFLQMNSLRTLKLSDNQIETVEKGAFNDLHSLVRLDLRGNPLNNFTKDMFSMLKSLRYLWTDSFKFCCLVSGIVSFDRCYPQQDEISDCEDLMSNTVQRLILWVLGIVAFFGNMLVVIWRFRNRSSPDTNPVSSRLILSLGCSDFLMGIYLLIIASVDEFYRGRYIENSDYWKNSLLCQFCGFLSTLSSEMSVATLVFITIDRLIVISFNFSDYRFTLSFTYKLLGITWFLMFIASFLPLLPIKYFNSQFYSRSGVCLALHITRERSPGWEYSVAIFIVINMLAFLIILSCYCCMYRTITSSTKRVKEMMSKQAKERKIGRQMLLIVLTNFLCWFPVILMGFLALANITIPGAAYSWTAVFVLPLNSATNPVIYTLLHFIPNLRNSSKKELGLALQLQHRAAMRATSHKLRNDIQMDQTTVSGSSLAMLNRERAISRNLLLGPPPGYVTLKEFINHKHVLTQRDLIAITRSVCKQMYEIHQMGYVLNRLDLDTILVTQDPILAQYSGSYNLHHCDNGEESDDESEEPSQLSEVLPNRKRRKSLPKRSISDNVDGEGNAEDEDDDDDGVIEMNALVTHRRACSVGYQTYVITNDAYPISGGVHDGPGVEADLNMFGVVVKKLLQTYHIKSGLK